MLQSSNSNSNKIKSNCTTEQHTSKRLRHRKRCNYAVISLIVIVAFLNLPAPATPALLVIPNELPSILSVVYSNIPVIKKGTDSRLGFGYRLGENADFQIMLELGPQKETRPVGDKSDDSSFNKRQVDKSQQLALQRELKRQAAAAAAVRASPPSNNVVQPTSWLEKWSQAANADKKKTLPKYNKSQLKKQQTVIHVAPPAMPAMPQIPEPAMQQLQMLYKMATTTEDNKPTTDATLADDVNQKAIAQLQERLKLYKAPSNIEELQKFLQQPNSQSKSDITKDLMNVSLDNDDE